MRVFMMFLLLAIAASAGAARYEQFLTPDSERPPEQLAKDLMGATYGEDAIKHTAQKVNLVPKEAAKLYWLKEYSVHPAEGKRVRAAGINPTTRAIKYFERDGHIGEELVCIEHEGARSCLSSWCGNPIEFIDEGNYVAAKAADPVPEVCQDIDKSKKTTYTYAWFGPFVTRHSHHPQTCFYYEDPQNAEGE